MWKLVYSRKGGFKTGDSDDDVEGENLLPYETRTRERRRPSWCFFSVCLTVASCLSVAFATWITSAMCRDADAFSIRHTSQYCEFFFLSLFDLGLKQVSRANRLHAIRFVTFIAQSQVKWGTSIPTKYPESKGHQIRPLTPNHATILTPYSTHNRRRRHPLYPPPLQRLPPRLQLLPSRRRSRSRLRLEVPRGRLYHPHDPLLHTHPPPNPSATDSAARIPPELAAKSGLAPDQVKISQKHGGGYPAHVEGMHHLHCLVSQADSPGSCMQPSN